MEMKQVNYPNCKKDIEEILYEGDYKNHHFIIRNIGKHPCAYIESKLKSSLKHNSWDFDYIDYLNDNISVHVSINYLGKYYWHKKNVKDDRIYIGWDYGHCGDWCGYDTELENLSFQNRKWTTEEIYEEIKNAIEQLIKIENKEEINYGFSKLCRTHE